MSGKHLRKSIRIDFEKQSLSIYYKFISKNMIDLSDILCGRLLNLSRGGLLFEGPIPDPDWVLPLGEEKIYIGCNLLIYSTETIKALARVRWLAPSSKGLFKLGLEFIKIDSENVAKLDKFLIRSQIETRKINRKPEFHNQKA